MEVRRLIVVVLACTFVVLGGAFVVGNGTGPRAALRHVCSATDRQFLETAQSNLAQYDFWAGELAAGRAEAGLVAQQAVSEQEQVAATRPTDPTFLQAGGMLRALFAEAGRGLRMQARGRDGSRHLGLAHDLGLRLHELLAVQQPELAPLGCDPGPLLAST